MRIASDIELHVTMHEDGDGRLKPPYLRISYRDVRHFKSLPVISARLFS